MDCFSLLGLPEEYRPKPVQLVKHRHEVPASRIQYPVYGQVKRDGVFAMLIKTVDSRAAIFGRTGKLLSNTGVLADSLSAHLQPGVYMGELQTIHPAYLEQLSGVVNPNRVEELDETQQLIKEGLYISFFDMQTIQTFVDGKADTTFLKRWQGLKRRMEMVEVLGLSHVLDITELNNEEDVEAHAQSLIDAGHEGGVYSCDADYEAGHKGWRKTKIVRGLAVDLLCIGYVEGKGKYAGKVANLTFRWKDGKTVDAMLGRGWTHDDAEKMYQAIKFGGSFLNPIGKIFTVTALQESSKGKLRNIKAGHLRHDKTQPDY
ncbi:DNA ligase [Erwinia phage phiEa1H]|uniref:DNA ligase n=1 Tax=Erwinia phage phiEa100 TaxID=925983 RepID=E5AGJ0_9CAUD|nr:DNA ligase [Erwinia phage phiEa100]CBX44489.1 DNA ligase [Erwinia phage phiEa1H]CBX45092.1 DNA ligase [Erwinia phage phiEa100]